MLAKALIIAASIAFSTLLIYFVVEASPAGESETRAWLIVALVVAYPFQTYWALKRLAGGL